MSKPTNSKNVSNRRARLDTPLVVYLWIASLGLMGYLVVGRIVFWARPHPVHWIAGLAGGVLGYFVGWLWYRWHGDVI